MDQQKLMEFQQLSGQLQQLQEYLQVIEQQMEELSVAQKSVEEITAIEKGRNIRVPLANGIYVDAVLGDTSSLLLNIGQGVIVGKTPAETIALLNKQFSELGGVHQEITQQFTPLYQQYVELQLSLEEQ